MLKNPRLQNGFQYGVFHNEGVILARKTREFRYFQHVLAHSALCGQPLIYLYSAVLSLDIPRRYTLSLFRHGAFHFAFLFSYHSSRRRAYLDDNGGPAAAKQTVKIMGQKYIKSYTKYGY